MNAFKEYNSLNQTVRIAKVRREGNVSHVSFVWMPAKDFKVMLLRDAVKK